MVMKDIDLLRVHGEVCMKDYQTTNMLESYFCE